MAKTLKELLEAVNDEIEDTPEKLTPPSNTEKVDVDDDDDDDEKPEEKLDDNAPDGKGHYTADDLREIIDYTRDLIEKENDEDDDDDDTSDMKDKKAGGAKDVGEVGLDLIYEYADLLPETVINQIVDDLKDMFEIEDTMLESIIIEGSAFFNKAKKSPAAIAASRKMKEFYIKNKKTIKKRNTKWRTSDLGKKIAALHNKVYSSTSTLGKKKGKRCVHKG